jgi:hypothetical protein
VPGFDSNPGPLQTNDATETIHVAELQAIGLAVRPQPEADSLRTLRPALEGLRSPKFETAMNQARTHLESALSFQ